MYDTFSLDPPPALPRKYNPFFIVLGVSVAIIGAYSSLQFFEGLVASKLALRAVHRKANVALAVGSTAFSMSTLTVWMMHFASMISVTLTGYTTRYELGATIGSMILIFLGSLIAICIMLYHKNGLLGGSSTATRSRFLQAYFDQPSDQAKLTDHLNHFLGQARALLTPRIFIAGAFLGAGVLAMHFTGMMAMRTAGVMMSYNPILVAVGGVLGVVGGAALLLLLMTMHGLRRRIVGAIIMGIAATSVHWYGYFCTTAFAVPTGVGMGDNNTSEVLVDAEVACVIVLLISSLSRFTLMGLMAAA